MWINQNLPFLAYINFDFDLYNIRALIKYSRRELLVRENILYNILFDLRFIFILWMILIIVESNRV